MDREYDLFERMPDGSLNWRGFARGRQKMRARLGKPAIQTTNECFAVHTPTHEVVGSVEWASGKELKRSN